MNPRQTGCGILLLMHVLVTGSWAMDTQKELFYSPAPLLAVETSSEEAYFIDTLGWSVYQVSLSSFGPVSSTPLSTGYWLKSLISDASSGNVYLSGSDMTNRFFFEPPLAGVIVRRQLTDFAQTGNLRFTEYSYIEPFIEQPYDGYAYFLAYRWSSQKDLLKIRLSDFSLERRVTLPPAISDLSLGLPNGPTFFGLSGTSGVVEINAQDLSVRRIISMGDAPDIKAWTVDKTRTSVYAATRRFEFLKIQFPQMTVVSRAELSSSPSYVPREDNNPRWVGLDEKRGYAYVFFSAYAYLSRVRLDTMQEVRARHTGAFTFDAAMDANRAFIYAGDFDVDGPQSFIQRVDISTLSLVGVSPSVLTAGSSSTEIIMEGTDIYEGTWADVGSDPRALRFIDQYHAGLTLSEADLADGTTLYVRLHQPVPDEKTSRTLPILIENPVPIITSVLPSVLITGMTDQRLTLQGTGFVPSSLVNWNGLPLATRFVTKTTLEATVPVAYTVAASTISLTVFNRPPKGGLSEPLRISIQNPSPVLTALSPAEASVGDPAQMLHGYGENFIVGQTLVFWNEETLPVRILSSTEWGVEVSSAFLLTAGLVSVKVINHDSVNNRPNQLTFEKVARPGTPRFTHLSETMRRSDFVQAEADGTPADYVWSILPEKNGVSSQTPNAGAWVSPVLATTPTGLLTSQWWSPLPLGRYRVQVIARNRLGAESPAATAWVTLVNPVVESVRVYPNPWDSQKHRHLPIVFDSVVEGAHLRIFTVAGHHVRHIQTMGTSIPWDLKTEGGDPVASGLYLYVLDTPSGKRHGKLVVIR